MPSAGSSGHDTALDGIGRPGTLPRRLPGSPVAGARLRVDPIACDGRGLCAEALPELITLDDWGFPIISGQPVPAWLLADARETVRACPKLALRLERLRAPQSARHRGSQPRSGL